MTRMRRCSPDRRVVAAPLMAPARRPSARDLPIGVLLPSRAKQPQHLPNRKHPLGTTMSGSAGRGCCSLTKPAVCGHSIEARSLPVGRMGAAAATRRRPEAQLLCWERPGSRALPARLRRRQS
jgi:hypothetical protein